MSKFRSMRTHIRLARGMFGSVIQRRNRITTQNMPFEKSSALNILNGLYPPHHVQSYQLFISLFPFVLAGLLRSTSFSDCLSHN